MWIGFQLQRYKKNTSHYYFHEGRTIDFLILLLISLVPNLENVCWVCGEPNDHSKPVKSFDIEGEKVKFEEQTIKK